MNEIAHGAVKTNRPIYRGLYVALIKEVDRGAFSVVEHRLKGKENQLQ